MYPETADIETSTDGYASTLRRRRRERGCSTCRSRPWPRWLADRPGATLLDVGGGHNQLAGPLARRGHQVTVVSSDPSCRHRLEADIASGLVSFTTGNLIALPFADRSFDVAVSIRLVPHCRRWQDARRRVVQGRPAGRHHRLPDEPERQRALRIDVRPEEVDRRQHAPLRAVHARRDPRRVRRAPLRAGQSAAAVPSADGVPPHAEAAGGVVGVSSGSSRRRA